MTASYLGSLPVTPDEQRFYKELGARIAQLRKDRDLTQQELADDLGIAQQTFGHYEIGRLRVPLSMLPDLAALLGESVETVLGPLIHSTKYKTRRHR
ncbi:helix-turn-helix transcriptional regulator [Dyella sp. S184]|uniref:helix-turn-helix domain-containing protein n=1 Tax=Dyella sp. S184 TaxID=1641862 RepID=UPI00131DD72D|nr:helix-turn-helix transcriptional regulator [Dyella sp. S184]